MGTGKRACTASHFLAYWAALWAWQDIPDWWLDEGCAACCAQRHGMRSQWGDLGHGDLDLLQSAAQCYSLSTTPASGSARAAYPAAQPGARGSYSKLSSVCAISQHKDSPGCPQSTLLSSGKAMSGEINGLNMFPEYLEELAWYFIHITS